MGNISLDKLPLEADFLDLLLFHTGVNFSGFLGEYQNTKYPFHFNSLPQEFPPFAAYGVGLPTLGNSYAAVA